MRQYVTCARPRTSQVLQPKHAVAEIAEARKNQKYQALTDRVDFRAVGLETLGAFGPRATALFDEITSRIKVRHNTTGARSRLYRQVADAIQLGNAACILESHSHRHWTRSSIADIGVAFGGGGHVPPKAQDGGARGTATGDKLNT